MLKKVLNDCGRMVLVYRNREGSSLHIEWIVRIKVAYKVSVITVNTVISEKLR